MTLKTVPDLMAEAKPNIRLLDAATAMQEIAQNNGVVIDVREASEVEKKPAEQSVHIPRGVLEMMVVAKFEDAAHPIYLHCASGVRSVLAAEQLQRVGYTNVTAITCTVDVVCEVQKL